MFFEVASCCIVVFCYYSMVLAVYKHDRSAAALAKQLRFNHKGLTFNKHDKSAFTMTTIVVVLFLICYGSEFTVAVALYHSFLTFHVMTLNINYLY